MGATVGAVEFDAALAEIGTGVPDASHYQYLTTLTLDTPAARHLAALDPFSCEYRDAALGLYLDLRGRTDGGYVAQRDEAPAGGVPGDLWTGLVPWSFRDPALVAEHLLSWGQIFRLLDLPACGSVLEYGPGSGQILLMLARMGVPAAGVDICPVALEGIRRQASALGLRLRLEQAAFGEGFAGERFDRIVFFEAFHHALDFAALLARLRDRIKPGGRIILCGEPIVPAPFPGIPYPWGPRLDALSVFCMRRFGWMELGFTHDFFAEAARRAGWRASLRDFPDCGRARAYVLTEDDGTASVPEEPDDVPEAEEVSPLVLEVAQLQAELAAMRRSTSWRLTRPARAVKRMLRQWSG